MQWCACPVGSVLGLCITGRGDGKVPNGYLSLCCRCQGPVTDGVKGELCWFWFGWPLVSEHHRLQQSEQDTEYCQALALVSLSLGARVSHGGEELFKS